jgi:hypothetical protein
MGGLEQVANVVRAVRLGALALILTVAVGGSWAVMQPERGHAAVYARPAGIMHAAAQARTTRYVVIWNASAACGGNVVAKSKPAEVIPFAAVGANLTWQGCSRP